ncbi:hypothetical protein INS49_015278 [Diaporthe citri]|uniref:uncharacterized protein n=1 Tax=Diaporthe citri TaxID=83186 RepID=UPI001C7E552A|nr:uncharacterized protein INS49_015278 [Diaporthe citri]KAG6355894.1 hypothetical protein INS49_015278 [Diaporthe citri]
MGPEIDHDLDVEGDVLLVLQNPNGPFAVWGEKEAWEHSRPTPLDTESEQAYDYIFEDPAYRISCRSTTEAAPESPERGEPRRKKHKRNPASVAGEGFEVRFRLSSRHLILASPYFRAMLTGPWEENSSRSGSMYTINACDWDEEALTVLMNIIHGHSERIPRSMSLELLAKIAVLVDYYKCHKIVKFYSDTWTTGIYDENDLPRKYTRNFMLRLFTSCVFAQHDMFHFLTLFAVRETRGPLRTLGLPFPDGLIEKIDDTRMAIVEVIIGHYHDLVA